MGEYEGFADIGDMDEAIDGIVVGCKRMSRKVCELRNSAYEHYSDKKQCYL